MFIDKKTKEHLTPQEIANIEASGVIPLSVIVARSKEDFIEKAVRGGNSLRKSANYYAEFAGC